MKKKTIYLILLLVLSILLISCDKNIDDENNNDKVKTLEMTGKNDYIFENETWTYYYFIPSYYEDQKDQKKFPLIVMLHPCGSNSVQFSKVSRMNNLAEEEGFIVLYPEQNIKNHYNRCWRWHYESEHSRDDGTELKIIDDITSILVKSYNIDEEKIFVAGFSAGAAQAANLAAYFSDRFSGVAVVGGTQFRAATKGSAEGRKTLLYGSDTNPDDAGILAYEAMIDGYRKVIPAIIIHGELDSVVSKINGVQAFKQWITTNRLINNKIDSYENRTTDNYPSDTDDTFSFTTEYVKDENSKVVVQYIEVKNLAHIWSSGINYSVNEYYSVNKNPNFSKIIWDFFNQS